MNREQGHSKFARFADGGSHSVWNIVIFQIKEHASSRTDKLLHNRGAFSRVQLHPNFVEADGIAEGRNNLLSLRCGRNVQRDNQPIAGSGH